MRLDWGLYGYGVRFAPYLSLSFMKLKRGKVRRLFGLWKTRGAGGSKKTGLGRILPLARACALCAGMAGIVLIHGAPADAAASVLINGKPLGKIDDIVMETTGSRGVVKESFLKFMKANDGKFRLPGPSIPPPSYPRPAGCGGGRG